MLGSTRYISLERKHQDLQWERGSWRGSEFVSTTLIVEAHRLLIYVLGFLVASALRWSK